MGKKTKKRSQKRKLKGKKWKQEATSATPLKVHPYSEETADSLWLHYDDRLLGDREREAREAAEEEQRRRECQERRDAGKEEDLDMEDCPSERCPKGSSGFLEFEVEEYIYREFKRRGPLEDITFGPEGEEEWAAWAGSLAQHPTRTAAVAEEFQKDTQLHDGVLHRIQCDSEGKVGKNLGSVNNAGLNRLRIMNALACDVFARLGLPLPPELDLTEAYGGRCEMSSRTEGQHLYVWYDLLCTHYVRVVFRVVEMVVENPLDGLQEGELPAIAEPVFRGPFVALKDDVRQSILYQEWMKDDLNCDIERVITEEKQEYLVCGFNRSWDDDESVMAALREGDYADY